MFSAHGCLVQPTNELTSFDKLLRIKNTNATMAMQSNATKELQCKPHLVSLMKFLDGVTTCDHSSSFTREQLLEITPEDIVRKFNKDVFGVEEPPPNHNITPKRRCQTIKAVKWALSCHMPNKMIVWNEETWSANPTRSGPIKDLMQLLRTVVNASGVLSMTLPHKNDSLLNQVLECVQVQHWDCAAEE